MLPARLFPVREIVDITANLELKSCHLVLIMGRGKATRVELLNGWKEIANCLGRGVRTVQRYERELGLPVHRPAIHSVIARKAELDDWVAASPIRESFRLAKPEVKDAAIRELVRNVTELNRLREETQKLRDSFTQALEQLRINLRLGIPDALQMERRDRLISYSSARRL